MKITNLIENTEGGNDCIPEHGLSFYIETAKHKLLMDTGSSNLILSNAEKLGIDLSQVDTVILSHGHYDHSGGIIPFSEINNTAQIYMKHSALLDYYSIRSEGAHYIGIDKKIARLTQLIYSDPECNKKTGTDNDKKTEDNSQIFQIDDELSIFSDIKKNHDIPSTNKRLKMNVNGELVQDEFEHEQCLVVTVSSDDKKDNNKKVLLSGCAHHGILNIMERYIELFGKEPDVVISGFHLMKKNGYDDVDKEEIEGIAKELMKYDTTFYTCHCTGVEPYEMMKEIMGNNIHYIHCGDILEI